MDEQDLQKALRRHQEQPRPPLDLSSVPDEDLNREYWRRFHARRDTSKAGRNPKLKRCKFCGAKFGVREMRKHVPLCRKDHQQKTGPEGPVSSGVYQAPSAALRSSRLNHGAELKSSKPSNQKQPGDKSMTTLNDVTVGRVPIKVRFDDGTTGWAVKYGRPEFGGVHISICRTRQQARDLDVANDTGAHIIDRHLEKCSAALNSWEVL